MENSMINSKKIHTSTRHAKDGSCKISSDLDKGKHVNKNHTFAYHWCDTNCHTLLQKFTTSKPQMINV